MTTLPSAKIDIYNNYATPLAGTFLNLPEEPCLLQCPSCGIKDMTKIEKEMHRTSWYTIIMTRLLHGCCCCCLDQDLRAPCMQLKPNHYCNNCGCYFGQRSRFTKLNVAKK